MGTAWKWMKIKACDSRILFSFDLLGIANENSINDPSQEFNTFMKGKRIVVTCLQEMKHFPCKRLTADRMWETEENKPLTCGTIMWSQDPDIRNPRAITWKRILDVRTGQWRDELGDGRSLVHILCPVWLLPSRLLRLTPRGIIFSREGTDIQT